MNNLDNIKETAWNLASWTTGWNNAKAAKDVWTNDYRHNEFPSFTVKTKQIATEVLHGGLKWAALGLLGDKTLVAFNVVDAPTKDSLRYLPHQITLPNISIVQNNLAVSVLGLVAVGYTVRHALTNLSQCNKHMWKAKEHDSVSDIIHCVGHFANAALVVPVAMIARNHGLTAGIGAASVLALANHGGKLSKNGALAIKAAIVASIIGYKMYGGNLI